MENKNSYEDAQRAETYAKLEYPGTYYLAYRDIPELIKKYVNGKKALDFGCGTGRSMRFLKKLGLDTIGIDISQEMLTIAKNSDPDGEYILVKDGDLGHLKDNSFDLILSAFTFDNISDFNMKIENFKQLRRILKDDGVIISIVSTPDIYIHEWMSFSTKDYPENNDAVSGDIVKIIITDTDDPRPVEDTVCSDEDYQKIYNIVNLKQVEKLLPLGKDDEPYDWVNENKIAPWCVYVLGK
ncbi:MAG: class I SAM-dependent methyltransferase [Candidatus Zixiibacteriota bacterium]